jgi:dephospho-CoA kinase
MILAITGTNGSGKGAVVDHLVQQGFVHFSVRAKLREALEATGTPIDRTALRNYANELRREHGAGYFGKLFLTEIREKGIEHAVIESIRTVGELEALKAEGVFIIAVDANRELRYSRIKARASHTDNLDFETFVHEEEREWHGEGGSHDMNLMDVIARADVCIKNEGTLEDLHIEIDRVLENMARI